MPGRTPTASQTAQRPGLSPCGCHIGINRVGGVHGLRLQRGPGQERTARATYDAPANPLPASRRPTWSVWGWGPAEGRGWDLAFAVADARLMAAHWARRREGEPLRGRAGPAHAASGPTPAPWPRRRRPRSTSGRPWRCLPAGRSTRLTRGGCPGGDGCTPDAGRPAGLLILRPRVHRCPRGLYLLPYDVGAGETASRISSPGASAPAELSAWLGGVDAGEIAMVVNACHSAAAMQQAGFKPGPLGRTDWGSWPPTRGCAVLAASQADDVAFESSPEKTGPPDLTRWCRMAWNSDGAARDGDDYAG